jgi:uncharacterized protein (TIGR02421 family)
VEEKQLQLAESLLEMIPPRAREESRGHRWSTGEFAERARRELEHYRQFSPDVATDVEIRDDLYSGMMVSRGKLLVGKGTRVPESRIEALIQHEIGTHVLTYVNGRSQPLRILYDGLIGYEELQEGLAVLAEYLVGGLSRPRLRLLAARIVTVKALLDGASFVDTFRLLHGRYHFEKNTAFNVTMRVFRGGGLTKDKIYLRGLVHILEYVSENDDIELLFAGKIGQRHIPIVRELLLREVLRPPPLRPRYLELPDARKRLERIRRGCSVLDLIKKNAKE